MIRLIVFGVLVLLAGVFIGVPLWAFYWRIVRQYWGF